MGILHPPPAWEDFEIRPIKRSPIGTTVASSDDEADFFTLYGVLKGDLYAIGDYNTRKEAQTCQNMIRPGSISMSQELNLTPGRLTDPC